MQIRPVTSPAAPRYPTEARFATHPELFLRYIPSRWRHNKVVGPALTAFVMAGLGGCKSEPSDRAKRPEVISDEVAGAPKRTARAAVKVAPIFAHGEGSGSTGCMAFSPPVFLSEEEAMHLIGTELAKEGIFIERIGAPEVEFDVQKTTHRDQNPDEDSIYFEKATIRMDGIVRDRKFVIEYVSHGDICAFHSSEVGCMDSFHPKRGAELLQKALTDSGQYNAAVFYEPLPSISYDQLGAKGIDPDAIARELLLAQVHDFLEWVKREKVLD